MQLSRHADIVQPQPVKNYSRTLLMFKIMKVSECYTFILCVQEFQTIIGKSWSKKIKHFFSKSAMIKFRFSYTKSVPFDVPLNIHSKYHAILSNGILIVESIPQRRAARLTIYLSLNLPNLSEVAKLYYMKYNLT